MITEKTPIGEIMKRAYENGILIPAFNVAYLPMIRPIVDTLKRMHTFALVEVARPDVERFGAKSFQSVAEEYHKLADRNFSRLHLDHVPVIDEEGKRVDWKSLIKMGLDLEYDSVMIDGSRLPLEENIAVTREVVELAHRFGRPVEAELGAVLGHEPGPLPPYEELFRSGKGFTDPQEAERFVKETKVDWLSIAIGNVHGAISGVAKDKKKVSARLNIKHLKRISQKVGIPLVLHGGSGIKREYVLEAIKNGISKMNIGTSIRQAYERSLSEKPDDIERAQENVALEVERLIKEYEVEGSWERL
ncbi:MAG TPA: class II fructose-bisphosphate aldolase [Candidatus Aerophobetes bacterium]|nr:class II fructose-bisphosphate aldolase [Candidatus Aerophobetes bacterium]